MATLQCPQRSAFAHPDDWPILRRDGGAHIDEEPRDFAGFVTGPRFDDTRFHLPPQPTLYDGDLDSAKIAVLLLDPGFGFSDYYAETCVPEFRRRLERTLPQDFTGTDFSFIWFDPQYCWHGRFVW